MLECVDIYDYFITLNIAGSDYIRWYLKCLFPLAGKMDRWTNERIGSVNIQVFFSNTKPLTVPVSNNCSRTPVRSSSVIAGASKIASIQKVHYQSGLIWTSTKTNFIITTHYSHIDFDYQAFLFSKSTILQLLQAAQNSDGTSWMKPHHPLFGPIKFFEAKKQRP